MKGKIVRLIKDKGFGFIRGEDGLEYFFHSKALRNCEWLDVEVQRDVTFEESENEKGLRAEDVYI